MKLSRYTIFCMLLSFMSIANGESFSKGQKLQLLSNLHPDFNKQVLYTTNYQLPNLMPMCSEVTVVKKNKNKFVFEWKSVNYTMQYDKHTKRSGASFDEVLSDFFGEKCDQKKVNSLSDLDQKGIRKGIPYEGMSRQGILFTMGRPPRHANPDLGASTWMYWLNRFKRKAIDFDSKEIVEEVRL